MERDGGGRRTKTYPNVFLTSEARIVLETSIIVNITIATATGIMRIILYTSLCYCFSVSVSHISPVYQFSVAVFGEWIAISDIISFSGVIVYEIFLRKISRLPASFPLYWPAWPSTPTSINYIFSSIPSAVVFTRDRWSFPLSARAVFPSIWELIFCGKSSCWSFPLPIGPRVPRGAGSLRIFGILLFRRNMKLWRIFPTLSIDLSIKPM